MAVLLLLLKYRQMHTGTWCHSLDSFSKQGFSEIQNSHKAFFLILEHLEGNRLVLRETAAPQ